MRYAGLRRGEVLALTMDGINFENNIIHITKAVCFDENKPILWLPKTKVGKRTFRCPHALKRKFWAFMSVLQKRARENYINAIKKQGNERCRSLVK